MSPDHPSSGDDAKQRQFATTQWSVVLAAAGDRDSAARRALAELCETYWYPLYAYARKRTADANDARDLTQAFFCHLLEKHVILRADRRRGRFRSFLLAALQNFLINEWKRDRAAKRGGAQVLSLDFASGESRFQMEPAHDQTPEKLFERRWVLTLLDTVLGALQAELAAAGKAAHFEALKTAVTAEATADDYQRAGEALGISAAAAKQEAYRMRKRYRQLFRAEVSKTLEDPGEVDDEIARLLESLRG